MFRFIRFLLLPVVFAISIPMYIICRTIHVYTMRRIRLSLDKVRKEMAANEDTNVGKMFFTIPQQLALTKIAVKFNGTTAFSYNPYNPLGYTATSDFCQAMSMYDNLGYRPLDLYIDLCAVGYISGSRIYVPSLQGETTLIC